MPLTMRPRRALRQHSSEAPRSHRALAALLAVLLLGGCATVRTTGSYPSGDELGGIEVRVFEDPGARRDGRIGPLHVSGLLERWDGEGWEVVFRSLRPSWTVVDLPPGKYRLRFPATLGPEGEEIPLEDASTQVKVRPGRIAQVEAVLEEDQTAKVVVGVAAAVVAAILIHEWLDDHDGRKGPRKAHRRTDSWVDALDILFHVTVDLALLHQLGADRGPRPPVVTSHFPEQDALVASDRIRVVVALSEPLEPESIYADTLEVVGAESGPVSGETYYDADRWWLVWEPTVALPRGDELEVILLRDGVRDLSGLPIAESLSFSFRTAG